MREPSRTQIRTRIQAIRTSRPQTMGRAPLSTSGPLLTPATGSTSPQTAWRSDYLISTPLVAPQAETTRALRQASMPKRRAATQPRRVTSLARRAPSRPQMSKPPCSVTPLSKGRTSNRSGDVCRTGSTRLSASSSLLPSDQASSSPAPLACSPKPSLWMLSA